MKKLKLIIIFLVLFCVTAGVSGDVFVNGVPAIAVVADATLQASGMATAGRAATATLYVSPNGDGTDGLTWDTAYTTIQAALTAASTDVNECTLILIGINTGANHYNINTTGDPTFTGNYILQGSHRTWTKIMNDHGSATSILNFTGYTSLIDLNFNLGVNENGIEITSGAARVNHCQFVGENLTSERTALHLNHATGGKHAKINDCYFLGNDKTKMTALKITQYGYSNFERVRVHECLAGIQIIGAASDANMFYVCDLGDCATGLDIDAGNEQHFRDLIFHHNTTNIDEFADVGDHVWGNLFGSTPISTTPDNFTGVTVATGAGTAWTASAVTIRAAAAKPFRVIGISAEADATEKFRIKLSDGTNTFADILIEGTANTNKRENFSFPRGTDYIFNKGTVISAYSKSESGSNNAIIWLEIQEI